jgi:hypothetical protein
MGDVGADQQGGVSLSGTIDETIARLHQSGFLPERIADMLGLEISIVREKLPACAGADLSWLPTAPLRSAGRAILALREKAKLEVGARAEEYADEEIRFVRHATRHGMTAIQLTTALTWLSSPRSVDSIAHASKKYGIMRLQPGTGRRRLLKD